MKRWQSLISSIYHYTVIMNLKRYNSISESNSTTRWEGNVENDVYLRMCGTRIDLVFWSAYCRCFRCSRVADCNRFVILFVLWWQVCCWIIVALYCTFKLKEDSFFSSPWTHAFLYSYVDRVLIISCIIYMYWAHCSSIRLL